MKHTLIFLVLLLIGAPLGAFSLAVIDGLLHSFIGVEFNADESWLKSFGYAYGLLAGYFLWGVKA